MIAIQTELLTRPPHLEPHLFSFGQLRRLSDGDQAEVLEFLAERPLHNVAMAGSIRDNGPTSSLNRGAFYSFRNDLGKLEGVALLGHAILMDTRTDRALQAFAEIARELKTAHMIMGEQQRISEFWDYYSEGGQQMRVACQELLFELQWPVVVYKPVPSLLLATESDLEFVMRIQAQMAVDENGIDPLQKDPEGFRKRCVHRIKRGRTWVSKEHGKILFKAEVMAETPENIYLEGVWVDETQRGRGFGIRCLSQLSRQLLSKSKSISLLVNKKEERAQSFYRKAGFKFRSTYTALFLETIPQTFD
jgi:predicted GNAT family acetyltransferase